MPTRQVSRSRTPIPAALGLLGLASGALLVSCIPYQQPVGPGGIQNPPQERYGQRADGGRAPNGTIGRPIGTGPEGTRYLEGGPAVADTSASSEVVDDIDRELGVRNPGEGGPPREVAITPDTPDVPEPPTPPTPPTPPAPPAEDIPFAKRVAGRPGTVYSPFAEGKQVDVSGMEPGTKVTDPHTGKVFLVP